MNTIANVLVSARPEQQTTDDRFWRIAIVVREEPARHLLKRCFEPGQFQRTPG